MAKADTTAKARIMAEMHRHTHRMANEHVEMLRVIAEKEYDDNPSAALRRIIREAYDDMVSRMDDESDMAQRDAIRRTLRSLAAEVYRISKSVAKKKHEEIP